MDMYFKQLFAVSDHAEIQMLLKKRNHWEKQFLQFQR